MNSEVSPSVDIHRLLPQDQDAELGILGSILLSPNEVMEKCIEKRLEPDAFYVPAHATIYGHLQSLYAANKPIDFIILTNLLRDVGDLDKVGGPAFVTALFTFVPTASNAMYYIDIVLSKQVFRGVIVTCNDYSCKAYDSDEDAMAFLDHVESGIHSIAERHVRRVDGTIKEHALAAMDSIEALYERRGVVSGLTTGFTELDRMIDGLKGPDMIVIAARPSIGKSAIAMNIVEHVAMESKLPVGVFSLEMSSQQLTQRMICSRGKINMQLLRDGFMNNSDMDAVGRIGAQVATSPIFMDDTSALNILELRAKARRWKAKHDIQLIVIDYLQLLKSESKKAKDNRQIEIAEISSGVKALAKELKIPIIILAQLNRNPEGRSGGKPRLSDLRESGSIEQDSDIVGLLNREEYYADEKDKEKVAGQAVLDIAKNRNGPTGSVDLTFIKHLTRFETRTQQQPEQPRYSSQPPRSRNGE